MTPHYHERFINPNPDSQLVTTSANKANAFFFLMFFKYIWCKEFPVFDFWLVVRNPTPSMYDLFRLQAVIHWGNIPKRDEYIMRDWHMELFANWILIESETLDWLQLTWDKLTVTMFVPMNDSQLWRDEWPHPWLGNISLYSAVHLLFFRWFLTTFWWWNMNSFWQSGARNLETGRDSLEVHFHQLRSNGYWWRILLRNIL